jgi:hypothetical protein
MSPHLWKTSPFTNALAEVERHHPELSATERRQLVPVYWLLGNACLYPVNDIDRRHVDEWALAREARILTRPAHLIALAYKGLEFVAETDVPISLLSPPNVDGLGGNAARRSDRTSRTSEPANSKLRFRSGEAFFEYQCKFGATDIQPRQGVVALVLDASKEFGAAYAVKEELDGTQLATLRVASRDGGFVVISRTPRPGGHKLQPDDVVIWVPVSYSPETVLPGMDRRSGWVGFIGAKINSVINPESASFEIACRY